MSIPHLDRWHSFVATPDASQLDEMLHVDVVFHSPVVHSPQVGKTITSLYLMAATKVFFVEGFSYLRTFDCGNQVALEFQTEIEGIVINGVDMIQWDNDGLITDFKVMVRPLKGIQKIHEKMGEMLHKMKPSA